MKKATIAPALPTGTGLNSGQARHTDAANAAAKATRPMKGVGGERSHHWSSSDSHAVPENRLLPAAPIHSTSRASPASSSSQS
jgi:hypothetical protein